MKVELHKKGGTYRWLLKAGNGWTTASSTPYNTKFHCKAAAISTFPKLPLIDKVKDRRKRA